jgi:hypothetical protein
VVGYYLPSLTGLNLGAALIPLSFVLRGLNLGAALIPLSFVLRGLNLGAALIPLSFVLGDSTWARRCSPG